MLTVRHTLSDFLRAVAVSFPGAYQLQSSGAGGLKWPGRGWQIAPAAPFGLSTEICRSLELQKMMDAGLSPPPPVIFRLLYPTIHATVSPASLRVPTSPGKPERSGKIRSSCLHQAWRKGSSPEILRHVPVGCRRYRTSFFVRQRSRIACRPTAPLALSGSRVRSHHPSALFPPPSHTPPPRVNPPLRVPLSFTP